MNESRTVSAKVHWFGVFGPLAILAGLAWFCWWLGQ